jgi:hypothetical protein
MKSIWGKKGNKGYAKAMNFDCWMAMVELLLHLAAIRVGNFTGANSTTY